MEFLNHLDELQPCTEVRDAAHAILADMWSQREAHRSERRKNAQKLAWKAEAEIRKFLDRIVNTTNPNIIAAYEKKISDLQRDALVWKEEAQNLGKKQPQFKELFEQSMEVLSNPREIWRNRDFGWKRMVLKVVFSERLPYCRKNGLRTAKTTLAFKVLSAANTGDGILARSRRFELLRV